MIIFNQSYVFCIDFLPFNIRYFFKRKKKNVKKIPTCYVLPFLSIILKDIESDLATQTIFSSTHEDVEASSISNRWRLFSTSTSLHLHHLPVYYYVLQIFYIKIHIYIVYTSEVFPIFFY